MSTPTTDVNQAFAETKTKQLQAARDKARWISEQLATGGIRQTGPNTFVFTQGWDAGESFTVSRSVATGKVEAVDLNHGLDTSTGTAALYTANTPAWHELGTVVPGGLTSVSAVLRAGGIDFEVIKRPGLYYATEEDEENERNLRTSNKRFYTVRTDTGADLGAVGEPYTVIQNRELFSFCEELVGQDAVVWESAGALGDGSRVFVSLRVPDSIVIDPGGINDETVMYIAVINHHSGRGAAQAVITPWRPVCGNTNRFALRDAKARYTIRHTSGAINRIVEARQALGLQMKYRGEFIKEETQLARTDLAIDDFHKLIDDLWPLTEEEQKKPGKVKIRDERHEQIQGVLDGAKQELGLTLYAGEQAITEYLDHLQVRRPPKNLTEELGAERAMRAASARAAFEGDDDLIKTKAHRKLLTLARR